MGREAPFGPSKSQSQLSVPLSDQSSSSSSSGVSSRFPSPCWWVLTAGESGGERRAQPTPSPPPSHTYSCRLSQVPAPTRLRRALPLRATPSQRPRPPPTDATRGRHAAQLEGIRGLVIPAAPLYWPGGKRAPGIDWIDRLLLSLGYTWGCCS